MLISIRNQGVGLNVNVAYNLVRYNANGTIDQTFGTGGQITTSANTITTTGSATHQILQQSDGKILAVDGTSLRRYNLDGSIDSTFAGSGAINFYDKTFRHQSH